jgi:hypothetical protein
MGTGCWGETYPSESSAFLSVIDFFLAGLGGFGGRAPMGMPPNIPGMPIPPLIFAIR